MRMEVSVQIKDLVPRRGITLRRAVVIVVVLVMATATVSGYTLADVLTILIGAGIAGYPVPPQLAGPRRTDLR